MIDVQALVNKHYDELVALRRYFHENPELSNVEDETCEYIQKKLEEYGLRTEGVPRRRFRFYRKRTGQNSTPANRY